ncbi:MAG: MFS transporter [Anaerolineae bacterium]|nr:MFS transporter [Anaerolineae bacterium]
MAQAAQLTASSRERIHQRNFWCFLGDFLFFSVGFNLLGPSTVIPDFVRSLTDSEILIGFSGQMFEVGWLLPQLLIARRLMHVSRKKWWFVGPNIPVRMLMLILAVVVMLLGPDRPHAILAAFLVFYAAIAIGDGLVGVPWLDLTASSLDDRRRARLYGLGTATVGICMLGLTPVVRYILSDDGPAFPNNYAVVFAVAGVLFLFTIPSTLLIREIPSEETNERTPSMREYLPHLWRVLREDVPFRTLVVVRLLVALLTMAWPFYIGFATDDLNMSRSVAVSNLLLMQTLGNVGGAMLFSRMGDRHTLQFIRLALLAGAIQPLAALAAGTVGPAPIYLAFLAAGMVQGMLGLSFLNWLQIYTTPEQRPTYSGLFNSVSAVVLVTAPLMGGLIVETMGYRGVFVVALVLALIAVTVAFRYLESPRAAASAAEVVTGVPGLLPD